MNDEQLNKTTTEPSPVQPFNWCLIANVVDTPDHTGKPGTKHFSPGTKLYCFPSRWGDGWERAEVLGRHRGGGRLVKIVMDTTRMTNFRAKQIFHPHVIREMVGDSVMTGDWDDGEKSKELAENMATALNMRTTICDTCGRTYGSHPLDLKHRDTYGLPFLTALCDGRLVNI